MYSAVIFLLRSIVSAQQPLHQKYRSPCLYCKFASRPKISRLLFPASHKCNYTRTEPNIDQHINIIRTCLCFSMISAPLRYGGANTNSYCHPHFECVKRFMAFIKNPLLICHAVAYTASILAKERILLSEIWTSTRLAGGFCAENKQQKPGPSEAISASQNPGFLRLSVFLIYQWGWCFDWPAASFHRGCSSRLMIPLHLGNPEHPQNILPARSPFVATRLTMGAPHLGHLGGISGSGSA